MSVATRFTAGLARQLGHPTGRRGHVVAAMLNRGNRAIVTAAVAALRVEPGETVADIGFGGGLGLGLLLDAVGGSGRVLGADISATMIARARSRYTDGRLRLHHGTMASLGSPDGSVDAAMTVHTLYFLDELEPSFGEVARVLVPGGRFVVGIGDPVGMEAIPATRYGFRLRPVEAVRAALEAAGLRLVDHQRVGSGEHAQHLLVTRNER